MSNFNSADIAAFKDVWVFCEQREGKLMPTDFELISKGRDLADELGVNLCGLLLGGEGIESAAKELGGYGADKVIVCESPLLATYTTDAYAKVICDVIEELKPEAFLIGATNIGRDLGPRCAARLHTGLCADCTHLDVDVPNYIQFLRESSTLDVDSMKWDMEDRNLKMTRPAFGGHLMATIICPRFRPCMATVRPGVMKKNAFDEAKANAVEIVKPNFSLTEEDIHTEVTEVVKAAKKLVDLIGADYIVSVGRGISKDVEKGIALAEELAAELGGVVGGSRATIDSGWLSADHQVGQTGKTVHPKVYVALGISGAIQHKAGMQDSECIIAVNKNDTMCFWPFFSGQRRPMGSLWRELGGTAESRYGFFTQRHGKNRGPGLWRFFSGQRDIGPIRLMGYLREPGNPVLTVELRCFPQLAAEVSQLPAVEALPLLRRKYPELRPQLLPIHTAAGSGLLLSVKSDWASIDEQCYPGIRIALVKTELGSGYTALWGGERSQDYVELGVKLLCRLLLCREPEVHYIGGSDTLPPPLSREREAELLGRLDEEPARQELIEHNLRLVVYIARRFENTGINIEDLISIGTIGLIKAVGTYRTDKNIKLATYASRCIENEILMYLRKNAGRKAEVSFDEPLNTDYDGNELLLSDVLGTEADVVMRPLEDDVDLCLLASALDTLTPREREIITLRFGRHAAPQRHRPAAYGPRAGLHVAGHPHPLLSGCRATRHCGSPAPTTPVSPPRSRWRRAARQGGQDPL